MTRQELQFLAEAQPHAYLTLSRKTLPRGDRVRLAGRSGPYGRICNVKEDEGGYRVVASFKSEDILRWLDSMS